MKGTKREFGKTMMSEEGYEFYKNARKVWSDAIKNEKQNKWIHEGWMEWSKRNSFGGQWRRKKARTVVDQEDESDSDAAIEDANAGVIWLPGDEEFDSVDNVGNNVGEDDDDEVGEDDANEGNEDGSR